MKLTQETFLQRSTNVWGNRWDYSSTVYKGARADLAITCPTHGEFSQAASSHMKGHVGCSGCSPKSARYKDFFSRAKEVWGDRWDYSSTPPLEGRKNPIPIKCTLHGIFMQMPRAHLDLVVGCIPCRVGYFDQVSFLDRSREVWGSRWDYTLVDYVNSSTPVTIGCPAHGEFYQAPRHHILGNVGCKKCRREQACSPSNSIIQQSREVWGDRWDYTEAECPDGYRGNITLRCREHGAFTGDISNHLRGNVSCVPCRDHGNLTTDEVIRRSKEVWEDRWDYSKTRYVRQLEKVTFTCREHGDFEQYTDAHFRGGVGCSKCSWSKVSKGEKEVLEYIKSLGLHPEENVKGLFPDSPKVEVDIWVPTLSVAIEFNGIYYHSEKFRTPDYHYTKFKLAQDRGITLLQIWEDDWRLKPTIIKRHLRQVLRVSREKKVNGRDLLVRPVSLIQAREFLNKYHIQGYANASVHLGAFESSGELVALASFKKSLGDYSLVRYATSCNVRGGHSKIISRFEKDFSYSNLVTFADLTFGSGSLYRRTGWVEDRLLPPDYRYVVKNVREHKFKYRLVKFKNDPDLKFLEGATERELAQMNGMLRIYDAGKIKFVKPHSKETND